eukprot:jgi/Mesvir1/23777/Mv10601-RA.1
MEDLNQTHHAFFQALVSRGPRRKADALSLYRNLKNTNDDAGFPHFLSKIQKELRVIRLDIRQFIYPEDGQEYFGVVNKDDDENAKLGTKFTFSQLMFFNSIMAALATAMDGSGVLPRSEAASIELRARSGDDEAGASSQPDAATQLDRASKEMTGPARKHTLDELVRAGWLEQVGGGRGDGGGSEPGVRLGVRAYLELDKHLENLGTTPCDWCKQPAIKAQICPNGTCQKRMHWHCAYRWSTGNEQPVCPGCSTPWPKAAITKHYTPPAAATHAPAVQSTPDGPSTAKKRRR